MKKLSLCRIDGVEAYAVSIGSNGAVSAEIGFTIEGRRFGMAQLTGLEDHPEVAELTRKLVEAIEGVVAEKMGSPRELTGGRQEFLGSGGDDFF